MASTDTPKTKKYSADERIARMKDGPTKERFLRLRRGAYNARPPRWSLRWWRNLAVRCFKFPYHAPTLFFWKSFNWTYRTFFESFIWLKHAWGPAAPSEIATMRMIRQNTTIPIPRVWWTCRSPTPSHALIFMDRVPGVTLETVWLKSSEEQRESYIRQLASMISQLRRLESPFGPLICSVTGGPIYDWRVGGQYLRGPFTTEQEFNDTVAMHLPHPRPSPEELCHDVAHPIRFTHGDIAPRNIMVKDGVITGLIDWENAGWYPAHWEYVKMHWANGRRYGLIADSFRSYIDRLMTPYPRELAADRNLILPYQPTFGAEAPK